MIVPTRLRLLNLEAPSQAGRPAHVSAASGLVRAGVSLFVVADDENDLGIFPDAGDHPGTLVRVAEGNLPLGKGARKRSKPDFESLVLLPAFAGHPQGALLALGSCSKPNRCWSVAVGFDARGNLGESRTSLDLAWLRDALESRFGCLNIEGAAVLGEELVLLQRGNKGDRRNARIRLRLGRVLAAIAGDLEIGLDALIDIHEHDLGSIGDVPLGFTDGAALPDGRVVFTAVAEDTQDSYADGGCAGSAVGVLDSTGRVEFLERIEGGAKVEGIEALVVDGEIGILMVTDADDATVPGALLAATLPPYARMPAS